MAGRYVLGWLMALPVMAVLVTADMGNHAPAVESDNPAETAPAVETNSATETVTVSDPKPVPQAEHSDSDTVPNTHRPMTPEQAIAELQTGNARFVAGKLKHPHEERTWRIALEKGQHPFAVVLGCSDSRVPPELVFDQGFGDLFVVRVAGNVVDTDVTGSIEYAVDHCDTHLVVVMGHTDCGAVTAAVNHLDNPDGEPAEVVSLLYRIEPAVIGVNPTLPRKEQISLTVKRNVELAVRRLSRVPDLRASLKAGRVKIVGAVYDMHTGEVTFLPPKS